MSARRAGAASALLVAALVVSGCAPAPDPDWTPPQWPGHQLRLLDALPAPLDPIAAAALTPQRLSNPRVGVHARMAYLPGRGAAVVAFNKRVDKVVRGTVQRRAAVAGTRYSPAVGGHTARLDKRGCVQGSTTLPAADILADPRLGPAGGTGSAVVCDIVAASGPFLGQRLRVVTGDRRGVAADRSMVLYADTETGETATGTRLWSDEAAASLHAGVVDALRRSAGALSTAPARSADQAQAER
ncbi:MAG: hypothetical protein QM611_09335, partial [Microbacterium sp.]|uniref:hypothetical protein n=1 Tax=Microbacterium sp. TaxID=51671 RepID=UPI0039E4E7AF